MRLEYLKKGYIMFEEFFKIILKLSDERFRVRFVVVFECL